MSILPQLRVLPPVGEHIRWQRSGQNTAAQAGAEGRVLYLQSGTAALALILQTISKRAREAGSSANEVLVPAYGCPDIVSAIAFAGLRARLVDLDGQSPFPSAQAWSAAINASTAALVTVGFLGLRDPFTPKEALASGLPAGAFVEDCCQVHPQAVPSLSDRSVALSFGRGKPVSLMHGGAALLAPELVPWRPATTSSEGGFGEFAKLGVATHLYNVLRSPWLYGWVTRLPGLGVGQTEYVPLPAIEPMNGRMRACLDLRQGWNSGRRDSLQRTLRQGLIDARPEALVTDLWRTYGRDGDWLLRYPLLLQSRDMREAALAALNAAGLGASPMYNRALRDIAGVGSLVSMAGSGEGAAAFADRLLTLPLHADVQDRDVTSMCEILSRVGRS